MKNFFALAIAMIFFLQVNTFSQEETVSLFGKNSSKQNTWGFYFGPEVKITEIVGITSVYGGIKAAMLLDHQFAVGLAAGSLLTETAFTGIGSDNLNVGLNSVMMYGGLYLDYITKFHSPVQISFPTVIGGGGFILLEKLEAHPVTGISDEKFVEAGVFFMLEPSVSVELNVFKKLRVGVGGGYRFVINSDLERISDADLSAPTLNLSFKYGIF
jgi:hypothetical protein